MDAAEREIWIQADRIFSGLIELDPATRVERLTAMSLPPPVRACLDRMLQTLEQQPDWLERDGALLQRQQDYDAPPDRQTMAGRRLGSWEIEYELARGGMAVVYRAHRVDGAADQVVALKLLTVASLGCHGSAQFRRETDILARLAHPHIVGLIDAGVADDGTPWLAMPLIQGEHIDRWCEQRALDTRQIVQLFRQVAMAVAAAHRNLVIHRDLKPSNMLVDAEGQVQLLDFGIARLIRPDDQATATQWRALTPRYAAPEQFTDSPPSTATDIYGLGAVLYRLLTGQSPEPGGGDVSITLPSRVARADAGMAARHLRALRNDLDRVLMKALATDPVQRYSSVDAFIADLDRWLAQRPVLATPPGRGYRLRKFIGRHRFGVAAAAGIVLALIGGLAGTLWQAREARQQAVQAAAARDFVLELFSAANPDIAPGQDPSASQLLRSGASRIRDVFSEHPQVRAQMLGTIGRVQLERGLLDDAQASLDQALAAFESAGRADPDWAVALGERGLLDYERGDPVRAFQRLQQAQQLAAEAGLEPDRPERLFLQVRSAEMLVELKREAEAERMVRQALERISAAGLDDAPIHPDALGVLAASLQYQGQREAALEVLLKAEAQQRYIAPAHPRMAVILNDLALLLHRLEHFDQAQATMQQALERHQAIYGERHPQTLHVMANRASLLRVWSGPEASAREYERLLPMIAQALGPEPHSSHVNALGQLALAQEGAGETETALQTAHQAWAMHQELRPDLRARTDWVAGILGLMLWEQDDPSAGELLAAFTPAHCDALETRTPFTRRLCIAQALRAADAGHCALPAANPPVQSDLSAMERHWWLAWWWLARRCGQVDAADAGAAISRLVTSEPLPAWLTRRLHRNAGDLH